MTEFDLSGFDVVAFLLVGLLIFGLFRGLRVLLNRRASLSRERRANLQRAMPAVEAFAYLVYAMTALPLVLDDHPEGEEVVAHAREQVEQDQTGCSVPNARSEAAHEVLGDRADPAVVDDR